MARQETILSVFVASPSDVDEERNRLEDVIRELNILWAKELGIRLELLRWETHAHPSFGEDAQAVINEQIPNDYDLFIGLMWYRFGTPTDRAGSGTIEEFERAKKRFDENPDSLQIMFYFKDATIPLAPSKIDTNQLSRVAKFRSCLGEEGGLYWSFNSAEDFEKLVRMHLTKHVQDWRRKQICPPSSQTLVVSEIEKPQEIGGDDDEAGLFDLMEKVEDEFEILGEVCNRIAVATDDIGKRMEERTVETNVFAAGPDSGNKKAAKRLVSKAASDIDQYTTRMESELPFFSQHFNSGMSALSKAATLAIDFGDEEGRRDRAKENLTGVTSLRETLATVEKQIVDFQSSVKSLPRMTSELNRSKRAAVDVLQKLINELQTGQQLAKDAEDTFKSILSDD